MAEDFFLDPPALARASDDLRTTARRLNASFTHLTGVLDAHHGCWGTDDIGSAFATNYVGPADEARKNGRAMVDGLVGMPDDIDRTSEVFQSVDEENARRIDRAQKKKD